MKDIRSIRTGVNYEWALAQAAGYFDRQPKRGTPAGDRFEVLLSLIEAYEAKHWAIDAPDPRKQGANYDVGKGLPRGY